MRNYRACTSKKSREKFYKIKRYEFENSKKNQNFLETLH